ncbi:hypothetical protein R1sor_001893 [Riccia sorocarpa]|uniref:CCHC-type domain-containing protein n=1 Tax=Riccia sorocarpa TaxID=122646 RepID=A0ABD3GYV6_9MARC
MCFSCQQRGHIAKDCPKRQPVTQREETSLESQKDSGVNSGGYASQHKDTGSPSKPVPNTDAYGFQLVEGRRKKTGSGSHLPQAAHANGQNQKRLDPLEESDKPEDLDEDIEGIPNDDDTELEETTENTGTRDPLQTTKNAASGTEEKIHTGNEAIKGGGVTGDVDSATSPSPDENTKIISWNICGLGSKHRLRTVKNWLRSNHNDAKILALQVLKAHETNLRFNLATVFENGTIVVDYACNDRRGAALILHALIKVLGRAVKGDGTVAWVSIQTPDGPLNIMSLYAPNKYPERRPVWNWLREKISTELWVIVGDWNMLERTEDSTCPSTILSGGEEGTYLMPTYAR